MRKTRKIIKWIICLYLLSLFFTACASSNHTTGTSSMPTKDSSLNVKGFLSTSGQSIINSESGIPVVLRGVNFPSDMTITIEDYKNLDVLNANMVRLALDFSEFSSNPDWSWLDQQIEWSEQNGIYIALILTNGPNASVWENALLQEKLINLWTSIASRYATEDTIAAYDLLDNPAPDNLDQWQSLAERIATSIRNVDDRHILIVQGTHSPERTFIYIEDPNTVLGFSFFKPHDFTKLGQGQYPSTELFMPNWNNFVGLQGIISSKLPEGTTEWYETPSPLTPIANRNKRIGIPSMNCQNSLGDVYFSNFVVEEYDETGHFLRNVVSIDFTKDRFWGPWSYKNSATIELVDDDLFGKAIKFSPAQEGQPATGTVADLEYAFEIITGHSYSIYGWIRGVNVKPDTDCKFYVEVCNFTGDDPLLIWDKEHLQYELSRLANYGNKQKLPMMLVDFGTKRITSSKGGEQWLGDMLTILDELGLHYAYSSLRNNRWGLFKVDGTSDVSLDEIFQNRLNNIPKLEPTPAQHAVTTGVDTSLGFVHSNGRELMVGPQDKVIYLRGINFSNFNYSGKFQNIPHHSQRDFFNIRDMGMNVIRFNLSYQSFENEETPYHYDQRIWLWLDEQIAWAKEAGVYIILNIHIIPGQMTNNMQLTINPEHQKRTAALWKAIAERYRDETTIAGYDLINEPYGINETEYQSYAQLLIDTIRDVDPNHLIIVEAINTEPPLFVLVDDENVMYDFHFYRPYDFSHENMNNQTSSGAYPDENYLELNWETLNFLSITRTPALPSSTSDWMLYESPIQAPASQGSGTIVGYGKIKCNQKNAGKAYFSDIQIVAVNPDNGSQSIVCDITINHNIQIMKNSSNDMDVFGISPHNHLNMPSGRALTIAKVNGWAYIEFSRQSFEAMPEMSYQIKGWMSGEDITAGSDCHLLIQWFQLPANEILVRHNRDYLQELIMAGVIFGQEQNVPVNVGEFGVIQTTLYPHKGGLVWLDDMLSLLIENNLNFTYWDYHGSWGIYNDMDHYPDIADAQQGMIDVFEKHLK